MSVEAVGTASFTT